MKTFFSLGICAVLFASSCNNAGQSTDNADKSAALQQFAPNKTAERQNLFLGFTEQVETDSSMIYTAKSLFEKDTVGMKIEVLKNIKPGINKEGKPVEDGFVKGAVKFSSIGAESDNLVKALSSLFSIPTSSGMITTTILPTVFSSNMDIVDLSKTGTYSFKLFLDNTKGEPAELSMAVDTYRKGIDIGEYRPEFREQVISAFTGQ